MERTTKSSDGQSFEDQVIRTFWSLVVGSGEIFSTAIQSKRKVQILYKCLREAPQPA